VPGEKRLSTVDGNETVDGTRPAGTLIMFK